MSLGPAASPRVLPDDGRSPEPSRIPGPAQQSALGLLSNRAGSPGAGWGQLKARRQIHCARTLVRVNHHGHPEVRSGGDAGPCPSSPPLPSRPEPAAGADRCGRSSSPCAVLPRPAAWCHRATSYTSPALAHPASTWVRSPSSAFRWRRRNLAIDRKSGARLAAR